MKKTTLLGVSLTVVWSLTACQDNSKSNSDTNTYTNEVSVQDTTINGQDNNRNGVRDDIDDIITKEYTGDGLQKAAMVYAQQLQTNIMSTNFTSDQAADMMSLQLKAATCLRFAADPSNINAIERLFASTVNTKARLAAMRNLSDKVGITSFTLPKKSECSS